MNTCRMCGARLVDDEELDHHNEQMHPNMAGKKGGEKDREKDREKDVVESEDIPAWRNLDRSRPID